MTGPDVRGAASALEAARPTVDRLDASHHPEEVAADLVEIWTAVEAALRALLGGSALSGQPLIRELRQRELISLEQAHAALELLAVRERLERSDYEPVPADVDVAREAYGALTRGFGTPAPAHVPPPSVPAPEVVLPPGRSSPNHAPAVVLLLLVIVIAGAGYYWYRTHGQSALDAGIAAYAAGQRDSARADFTRAAAADPNAAEPHVYLARMAREDGDYAGAARELTTATHLAPNDAPAQAELGAFFLARGTRFESQQQAALATQDYDAARRAYVRVLQLAPSDTAAQGYLGCALARLGRSSEAATWLARAGSGPWSACAGTAPNGTPPSPGTP